MTQLEERLRTALDELAAAVPPSANPAAEHSRRVAAGTHRRRPLLVAAAAAAVLAAVVVPIALNQWGGAPGGDTTAASPPHTAKVSSPVGVDPGLDDPYQSQVGESMPLSEFTEGGRSWTASVFLERTVVSGDWGYRLCVVAVPTGEPVNSPTRHPNSAGCTPTSTWPTGQPPTKVETRTVLGGQTLNSGPLPGLMLFVTAPEVSQLDVQAGDGHPVAVKTLLRFPELALFLADFGGSSEGFGYTAKDSAGNVVQTGIS